MNATERNKVNEEFKDANDGQGSGLSRPQEAQENPSKGGIGRMNRFETFRSLAATAARETPPSLDVTDRVLERIERRADRGPLVAPMVVFSGVSVLAASIAVAVALSCWAALTDPLGGLFVSLTMVMQ